MSKVAESIEKALEEVESGQSIMIGGFINCGVPHTLVEGLVEKGVSDIFLISNDTSTLGVSRSKLVAQHRIRRGIFSHIGLNPETGRQMESGELEVELSPQGTLAERIRCGGSGIGGFLTPTGLQTIVEDGKQIVEIKGKKYLLEEALHADVALIKAWKADEAGNLIYRGAARNFNPLMAMAADYVVAEVEEIVPVGSIDPNIVVTPGALVDCVILSDKERDLD